MRNHDPTVSSNAGGNDYLSLNGREKTIGFGGTAFTGSQTRYVWVSPHRLKQWADAVEDLYSEDEAVVVGLTPEAPLFAKSSKESALGVMVAPMVEPDCDTENDK